MIAITTICPPVVFPYVKIYSVRAEEENNNKRMLKKLKFTNKGNKDTKLFCYLTSCP